MPILVDFSQIVISNAFVNANSHAGRLQMDLLRHQVLQSLRFAKKEHTGTFGEMILCMDSGDYWRKDIFPYYKANRRKSSQFDWITIDTAKKQLTEEFSQVLPYRTLQVEKCEADDIIGTIASKFKEMSILILSADKDFKQLQRGNLLQYDPIHKNWVRTDRADLFLKEHIMRGDPGDGIPNFLSPDDSFVSKIKQRPIFQKHLDIWVHQDPEEFCDEKSLRYYNRNKQLVDLTNTPADLVDKIVEDYRTKLVRVNDRSKMFNYFMDNNLKELMKYIGDF